MKLTRKKLRNAIKNILNEAPSGPEKFAIKGGKKQKELAAIVLPKTQKFIFRNSIDGKNIFLTMIADYSGDLAGEVRLELTAYRRTIFSCSLPKDAAMDLIKHQKKSAGTLKNFIPGVDVAETHFAKKKKKMV